MSSIDAMSKLPALFPYSDGWNSRKSTDPKLKDGPSNAITPVYETRAGMVDQSKYYGSDYFFEEVGYAPETPVYVIGDNYYISELIRREVNDSVGTYFAVRDGVEGVDMVQMLMDNAKYVVTHGVKVSDAGADPETSKATGTETSTITGATSSAANSSAYGTETSTITGATSSAANSAAYGTETSTITGATSSAANSAAYGTETSTITGATSSAANSAANGTETSTITGATNSAANGAETSTVTGTAPQMQDLGLVVGVAPTSEQLKLLDKDIVWFVNQTVDGEQVLVPFVYLANTTLDDMSNSAKESSGSAVIHAKGDVNIDATSVNNSNAIISAGNDVNIKSEGDINNKSNGASGGIIAKNDVNLTSTDGSINNDGAYIKAGDDINMQADNGSIEMTASVGRDDKGKQQVHTYDDAISAGGDINIKAKDITSNAAIIEAGNDINMKSTEGDITFNDMHEISADYTNDMDIKNAINYRKTEIETTTATSVAGQVTAGGKLNIDSAKDVIMKGGEYSGTDGSITAAGDVDMQATQDYSHTEESVKVREFSITGQANAMGYSASAENSGLDGKSSTSSSGDYGYDYGSDATGNGSHSPGKSAVGPIAESFIGYRSSTDTSTEDTKTNKNGSFNFSNNLNVDAKTVDIGGADLKAGNELNITADELKTTKYTDTDEKTFSHENLSIGATTSVSSVFSDIADKDAGMIENKVNNPDVGFDGLTTAAQTAGDITNLIFNDYASINTTLGVDYSKSSGSSKTTSENITHIDAGKVNIKTKGDTTLAGTDIKAGEVSIDAGGDVNMRAAEKTSSSNEDGMYVSVGVSVGAAVDKDSAGAGVSLDASGGNNHENNGSKSYTNSTITADNVSIKSGNDTNLIGADITAKTADITTGGDLNVVSVQDTVDNDASSWHAGMSVGVAATTDGGVIPTFSANGGGGSDYHDSATTAEQSGIHTSGTLNVTTGGDLNMTGGHLISDDHTGTVDTAGNINVQDLKDTTEQDGAYGGGGGGVTKTGASVNMYAQTTDEIHYKEDQHSTIDVGTLDKTKVIGDLNTDGSKTSTVVQDEKEWGSDISATVSVPMPSKKGSYDVDQPDAKKPADVEPISHKPIDADAVDPVKPKPKPADADVEPVKPKPADADVEPVKPTVDPKAEPADSTVEPVVDPKQHADSEDVPKVEPDFSTDPVKPTVDPKAEPADAKVEPVKDPDSHKSNSEDVPKVNPDSSADLVNPKVDPAHPDATDGGKKWPKVKTPERVVLTPGSATGNTSWVEPPKGGTGKNGTAYEGVPRSGSTKVVDTAPKASAKETTPEAKKTDPSQYNGKKWATVEPSKGIILSPGSSTNNVPSNATPRDGNTSNGGTYEGQPIRQPVKQLPDGASNWQPLLPEHTMASEHTYQDTEWSVSNTKINQRGGPVA